MDWHRKRRIITALFAAGIVLLTALGGVSAYIDAQVLKQNAELSKLRDHADAATNLLVAHSAGTQAAK
jgi:hypothetical protein